VVKFVKQFLPIQGMKKILVTTDFSTSSKAGLRFAVQLASQGGFELVFFHCFQALIPTSLRKERIENTLQLQVKEHLNKLERFVAKVLKPLKHKPEHYRCVVVEDLSPNKAILEFAKVDRADYICMATRGAGALLKLMGTNTSNIIVNSPLPVLVVPHTYRTNSVKKLLYAADLENFEREMPMVSEHAKSMDARIDLAHFFHGAAAGQEVEKRSKTWQKRYPLLDQVLLHPFDLDKGFVPQLEKMVKKAKPGIVVFFTQPNQTWYSKLFSPNRSESFSFVTKVPMLVCRKS
jgi:nucleotide-binding universal stress UspA family protein